MSYSALLDSSTSVVLAVSDRASGIVFLSKCMVDTRHAHFVERPNYLKSFLLQGVDPEDYPKWTWNVKTRFFFETRPDVITEGILERSRLAMGKLGAIRKIINNLSLARYSVRTG